ncbi:hypothetical protein [Sphingopyxis sp.]|jgi:hypothetical protein|uniref:hypothetical protein n=1 Tax=Sphingopyxis sp. TaxID=1908224 RepID=UPI002DFC6951|nr:hypothetical protein [Sphingopyxis sp.]
MKVYGTDVNARNPVEETGVSELREATLVVSVDDLKMLSAFFNACYEEYRGNPEWDHKHLVDFAHKTGYQGPDIIVYGSASD